jgi:transposase
MSICVGVDVSKEHLDWIVGAEGNAASVANIPAGVRRLVKKLGQIEVHSIIVESTGGYERALVDARVLALFGEGTRPEKRRCPALRSVN